MDEKKVALLLKHPLIWQDADKPYELLPELKAVIPEPRVSFIPQGETFYEPVVIPVPGEVFKKLLVKELLAVFMTNEDADAFSRWKLGPDDLTPKNTGPKVDKRTREYKQGRESKKVA